MSRLLIIAAAGALAGTASAPVLAADYSFPGGMRDGYDTSWSNSDMPSPISFDAGIRYFYSLGSHAMTVGADSYSADDTSHILEGFLRINDHLNNAFLDGTLGYAAVIDGNYSTPSGTGSSSVSRVMYAGTDFGMMPWTLGPVAIGAFGGYKYMSESVDQGFPGQQLDINSLRVGVAGQVDLGVVDLQFKAAAIPYAPISGTYASYSAGAGGSIDGELYGGEAEAFLGWHPTDMMSIKVGARGSYLTGPANLDDGTVTAADSLSFTRFGLLGELSAHF